MATILIVDDERVIREIAADILTKAGHVVRAVPDGAMAVEAFTYESFDVLVTDIYMPRKQGLDIILELRQKYPGLAIVAISGGVGGDAEGCLQVAEKLGANSVLAKPFTSEQLEQAVARAVELKRA